MSIFGLNMTTNMSSVIMHHCMWSSATVYIIICPNTDILSGGQVCETEAFHICRAGL